MIGKKPCILVLIAGVFILGLPAWGGTADPVAAPKEASPAPRPDPAKLLRGMTDYLKSLKQFSFRADITDDQVYGAGNKLQYALDMEIFVRRPDKLRINGRGDLENQDLFYDGKTLTIYRRDKNLYATAPMPSTIEEALAQAYKKFDLQVSLADLLCGNDTYEFMMDDVTSSFYVGLNQVRGVACHHLSFTQADFNWQIWIDAGDKPLPRKLLVNQKLLPGSPQWTAVLTDWNFAPELADSLFTFVAPAGAHQIKFLPPSPPAAPKSTPRGSKKGLKS